MSEFSHVLGSNPQTGAIPQVVVDWLAENLPDSGTSVPGVPIFESLAEAQAWEAANPGSTAYYVTADDGLIHVIATAPTFTDMDGTASDTYTIPASTGVVYRVGGSVVAAGTYPGAGSVTVTAEAASGYAIDGATSWSYTFSSGTAPTSVTPAAPSADDGLDRIYIPTVTGVDYQINGVTVTGVQSVPNTTHTVTVTAVAQSGYTLTGTTSWTFEFTASIAAMPSGGVALYTGNTLGASDSAVTTWTDEQGTWDLTGTGNTTVKQTATGAKFVSSNNAIMTAAISLGAPMSLGMQVRFPSWPGGASWTIGFITMSGANGAGMRVLENSGAKSLQATAHGNYATSVTDTPVNTWMTLVLVWDTASPMLRVYLNGTEIANVPSTTTVGTNTLLSLFGTGTGRLIDVSALALFNRSLTEAEALGLSAEIERISGITT